MTDIKLIHEIYESVINHALEERLSHFEGNYAVTKERGRDSYIFQKRGLLWVVFRIVKLGRLIFLFSTV